MPIGFTMLCSFNSQYIPIPLLISTPMYLINQYWINNTSFTFDNNSIQTEIELLCASQLYDELPLIPSTLTLNRWDLY